MDRRRADKLAGGGLNIALLVCGTAVAIIGGMFGQVMPATGASGAVRVISGIPASAGGADRAPASPADGRGTSGGGDAASADGAAARPDAAALPPLSAEERAYRTRINDEPRNEPWATQEEASLRSSLARSLKDDYAKGLIAIRCATTLCEIDSQWPAVASGAHPASFQPPIIDRLNDVETAGTSAEAMYISGGIGQPYHAKFYFVRQ